MSQIRKIVKATPGPTAQQQLAKLESHIAGGGQFDDMTGTALHVSLSVALMKRAHAAPIPLFR